MRTQNEKGDNRTCLTYIILKAFDLDSRAKSFARHGRYSSILTSTHPYCLYTLRMYLYCVMLRTFTVKFCLLLMSDIERLAEVYDNPKLQSTRKNPEEN